MLTNILPLVHTNGSVKILTLFLPGLTLLQLPRTKYLVAWLVIIRSVRHVRHQWHTSAIPLKTSQPCDVIQEDLQLCTSQININGSTNAIKFLLKRESRRMETSTTMANHDPRTNRTNPKYHALLGIVGTWSTSCDFCNCLLFALCVLDSVCSCLMCFLSVCCYFVLVLVLAYRPYKPLWHVKPQIGKTSLKCVSLSSICVSSRSIGKFKVKF
jgi:hypothetical protein